MFGVATLGASLYLTLLNLVTYFENTMSHRSAKPYSVSRTSVKAMACRLIRSQRHSPGSKLPDGQWLHDKAPGVERIRGPRPSAVESNVSNTPSAKLLVDNLHYEVSEKDLAVCIILGIHIQLALMTACCRASSESMVLLQGNQESGYEFYTMHHKWSHHLFVHLRIGAQQIHTSFDLIWGFRLLSSTRAADQQVRLSSPLPTSKMQRLP